jgi:cysteine desulfurase / selenocysteine lyase
MDNKSIDFNKIKAYFPIFKTAGNENLVYFDNAATTQRPREVLEAIRAFDEQDNANPHRGAYRLAERATARFEEARRTVAGFINALPQEIIFTRNATEAVNFVARGWADRFLEPGDEIVVSEMEHHSNLVPWQMAGIRRGASLRFWTFDEQGELDLAELKKCFSPRTRLLAVTHISNALGTINPIAEIIRIAHDRGVKVLVDAAQSVPHMAVDVKKLDADFVVFSGHKMLGPMGIGVLYAKREWLEAMDPVLFGGDMISEVEHQRSTWNEIPWKFEAGTQNVSGAVGLAAALEFIQRAGLGAIAARDVQLTRLALQEMRQIEDLVIYGPSRERGPVISFNLGRIHAHDLATFLDQKNIAIRSGHHCAQLVMKKLGVPATARASFYLYNSEDEVAQFIAALHAAREYFKKWL